jgi:hypothetical protein
MRFYSDDQTSDKEKAKQNRLSPTTNAELRMKVANTESLDILAVLVYT